MEKAGKEKVVEVLREIAALLELKAENVFKIRAFENAARILEGHPKALPALIRTGELETLKGIGKGRIAGIIRELYEKGRSSDHEELKKGFPDSLFELFRISGLGAKRVRALYEKLGIKSVGELEYACHENRLIDLDGFGEKSQQNILNGIQHLKKSAGLFRIDIAKQEAEKIKDYLGRQKGILRIEVAGSIRRHKEIVKDADILAAAKNPSAVHHAFVKYRDAESILAHGDTKSSIRLKSGMMCDLRTVAEKEFPFALYYFTGSKDHNVAVRTLAKRKGIKINEYGLFKGKRFVPCRDESEIFEKLGMHHVPPELRENTGEVEWALKKQIPMLVKEKDLRGILHVHSDYSDGTTSIVAIVREAQKLGYDYIGISDHSRTASYANGLEPARLRRQWKEIDGLQKHYKIRIFKGIESDIRPDGKLDYPDSILSGFDFVIGAVHARFRMSEKEMTDRICRAMENKHMTFLGHPTGRLLLAREGYAVDMEKVIGRAQKTKVGIEINANPYRLDLDWRLCRLAKTKGVGIGIFPDAHSIEGLQDVRYGVGIARKGWLEKKDVVNAWPLDQVEKYLRRRK